MTCLSEQSEYTIYDDIYPETLTREYKQLTIRNTIYLRNEKESEKIISGTMTKECQKEIRKSLQELIKYNLPKFISACSKTKCDVDESQIIFGVNDDGIIYGIPILDHNLEEFKSKIEQTIRKIYLQKLIGIKIKNDDNDILNNDFDNFQYVDNNQDQTMSFTLAADCYKTTQTGQIDKTILDNYFDKIKISLKELKLTCDPQILNDQEIDLISILQKDQELKLKNKLIYQKYLHDKTIWINKIRNYSYSNFKLFDIEEIYQDFLLYLNETPQEHLIEYGIQFMSKGIKCGKYFVNSTNYQKLLWKFKDDRKEQLKHQKIKEPKINNRNDKWTILTTLNKLTQRFIKKNKHVKYYTLEITVPNNINENEIIIYYNKLKEEWISKKRSVCVVNGILEPQCL